MATSPDGRPYGARWGFRTPSPDFARTAVEPLSPPALEPAPFAAKPPSTSYATNNYPPPPSLFVYNPSPYSRSIRDSSADIAPQYTYTHSYHLSDNQPQRQHRENNRLDALAEIALMHGASRLAPTPAYSQTLAPMASPVPVASTIVSSWQRPDPAQPSLLPRPQDTVDTLPHAQGFGAIGHERRSLSSGREHGNAATASRRSSAPAPPFQLAEPDLMLSPPSMVERLPPVASVLDSLRAALAPKPEDDHPRPWINPSPVDQFMASPGGEDHSITVQPLGDRILEEDEDAESDGPRNTSLPTPTQEDHVIASSVSSVSLSDAIPEKAAGPNVHDSIATLTPELADSDSIDAVLAIARARYSHDHPMADAPENEDTLVVDAVKERVEKANDTEAANDTPEADIASPPKRIIANKDIHTPLRVAATPAHDRAINRINKADEPTSRSRRLSNRFSRPPDSRNSRKSKGKAASIEPRESTAAGPNAPQPSAEDEDCQTCKVHYSEDDGRNGAWIGCDGCKGWHHARCVRLEQSAVDKIDKFYCVSCEVTYGKSTMKRSSGRARTAIDYDALHNGSSAPLKNPGDPRIHPYINKILEKSYPFAEDNLRRLRPELVTSTLIDSKDGTKWDKPFIVPAKWNPTPWHRAEGEDAAASEGPGISVPPPPPQANGARKRSGSPLAPRNRGQDSPASDEWTESEPRKDADALDMRIPRALTVRGVAEMIGLDTTVPMMNVVTQEPPKDVWTMGRLADYFESPVKETIYNCISCEVSNSPLGDLISRPKAVRETDLVDNVWKHAHGFPKPTVGKYVLMSVKDSFTDFHVDFGGSSVFYHIYEGKKVFLTIPPTEKALKMYEKWSSHESMNHTFLPDLLPDVPCTLLSLEKGDTLFIPSGWIHAVYTPIDSLVIGGNFLTRNFYANQMKIHHIEAVTGVPQLMRYPRFTTLMWASMFNYISTDQMPRDIEQDILTEVLSRKNKFKPSTQVYTTEELKGLPSLIEFLYRNVMIFMGVITTSQRPGGPKISKATVEAVKKAIIWPVSRDPLLYLKHFARWCIWKRACSDIVPGGERLPDWAQVGWTPPGFQAGSTNPDEPADAPAPPDGESSDAPRRGGLRDRSKLALTLDGSLEEFDYFPQRAVPAAIANLAGAGRSSSATPRHGKRKSDGTPAPSSKKSKSTRRNRQLTPMPADNDARKGADTQYLKLADGSIYVKKLSNLGPPRIGCESCRLKKTGCKHKEEIRARGWCDDERLTQELEPRRELEEDNYQAEDTPTKSSSRPASSVAPEPKAVDVSPAKTRVTSAPPLQKPPPQTPTQRPISKPRSSSSNVNSSSSKAGPPVGYKGRKPSCDDCKILKKKCLHQDTWKLVQDKQAAAEAKKAQKINEQTHRRQTKESKRKATVQQRQKATVKIEAMVERSSSPARESSPAFEVQDSIVLRAPTPVEASASPAPIPTPEPAPEPSVADAIPKARTPPKEAKTPTSRPTSKGKDAAPTQEDFGLGLDTSILEEAPQYTSAAKTPSPVASDPSIMAPPMDLFDDSPEAQKPVEEPRTMPPPPSPAAAPRTPTLPRTDPNLHAEYIAALHARPSSTSKPKVTYTSSNKSIKRKAEEESPEGRRVKKEVAAGEGQTTFENLRQLSLGLRVRGQRGGEVC